MVNIHTSLVRRIIHRVDSDVDDHGPGLDPRTFDHLRSANRCHYNVSAADGFLYVAEKIVNYGDKNSI